MLIHDGASGAGRGDLDRNNGSPLRASDSDLVGESDVEARGLGWVGPPSPAAL